MKKQFVDEFSLSGDTLMHYVAKYAVKSNKQEQFFLMLEDQSKSGILKVMTNEQRVLFQRIRMNSIG